MSSKPTALPRTSGILLHPTSLPSAYGIGDLGPAAHAWVDTLAENRQLWWQILPLTPPGPGHSPYAALSAFAGNPALISPDLLVEEQLIQRGQLGLRRFPARRVDFARVENFKASMLALAWDNYRARRMAKLRAAFEQFCSTERAWLDDYALFMAIRESQRGRKWPEWPRGLAQRNAQALKSAEKTLAESVGRERFTQFLFFRQWEALRRHAHARGVGIIGDLPLFVAGNSTDVWRHPEWFRLDAHGHPTVVAGVPPDDFSKAGQRWGNPIYRWNAMRRDHFSWWVKRFASMFRQADLVRIDHFRGFAACWEISASCPTAEKGRWVKAPGKALFQAVMKHLGALPVIAEDLGLITADVERLRVRIGAPGMRILQFAFGGPTEERFLPHCFDRNTVAYTGTHDNDTTIGWYKSLSASERANLKRYIAGAGKDPAGALLRLAWASIADIAIAPLQDVLRLGNAARMNRPGTARGNWGWRFTFDMLKRSQLKQLREWTIAYTREAGIG